MYKNGLALPILSAVQTVEVRVSDLDTTEVEGEGFVVVIVVTPSFEFGRKLFPILCFASLLRMVLTKSPRVYMAQDAGISRALLSRRFQVFLQNPPHPLLVWKVNPPTVSSVPRRLWTYGFDGKWLGRGAVVLIHRDVTHKETLWWSDSTSESMAAFSNDIAPLKHLTKDNHPVGTISDWKPGIVRIMGETWSGVYQQRCLVHVERDLKRLLPLHSPLIPTQHLREIAMHICRLKDEGDRNRFFFALLLWHSEYESLLKERTIPNPGTTRKRWWYTHSNLRRAWRILTHDTDSLFEYLDVPMIVSSISV